MSFDEALTAYTQAGADMTPWGAQIGSITPGKWADFVILDVMMPGIDGFEVCRQLRDTGDVTPILMLTGRDTTTDIVRGFDAGKGWALGPTATTNPSAARTASIAVMMAGLFCPFLIRARATVAYNAVRFDRL